MKKTIYISLIFSLICSSALAQGYSDFIVVDQFGYLEESSKVAVIRDPQTGYDSAQSYTPGTTLELRESNSNQVVFSANPTIWNLGNTQSISGDRGWWFDFSSVEDPGEYYVYDPTNAESSASFIIGDDVYLEVLKASVKMFYYNRCGTAKTAPYADTNWTDGASFLNPGQDLNARYIFDPNNANLEKDVSGGWYDAGDFNKYVTFTYEAIPNLLWAYTENPSIFTDDWNIPESGNGIPDILDEVIWELEWLMKMNNADGSTHNKAGSQNYSDNTSTPPSLNVDPRFYGSTCSSASITVAAIFSQAALVLKNFPTLSALSAELESRAISSFSYALPYLQNNSWETDCDDGSIISGDADWSSDQQTDVAIAAAVYLLDLTNDGTYNNIIDSYAPNTEALVSNFWSGYKVPLLESLLHYTTLNSSNPALASDILSSFSADASDNFNGYYGSIGNDLYRAAMPSWSWHWGSLKPMANHATLNILLSEYGINPGSTSSYIQKAKEQVHYFHGVNPFSLVYLSNMYSYGAENSCNEIYHQWFLDGSSWDNALTSLGPAPGYVPGGPNAFSTVPYSPPTGQPEMKSYLDFNTGYPENSWEISEPSITYQAAYIRMLSHSVSLSPLSGLPNIGLNSGCIEVFPNPTNNIFTITGSLSLYTIDIIDASGAVYSTLNSNNGTSINIDISALPSGTFLVRVEDPNNNQLCVEKILKF